jgi:uncharacterized membrane protein YfcA
MKVVSFVFLAVLLLVALWTRTTVASQHYGDCSLNNDAALYHCPNCNGTEVADCMDCQEYLYADNQFHICFRRVLFQPYNNNPDDPDHFYTFFWNDFIGAMVWFVSAGVAMACGVGGGGIYVPLGILLFQFAPKPASGLSQCSIFGASLGGLLLNLRNYHPNENIRSDAGQHEVDQRGCIIRALQMDLNEVQEIEYEQSRGRFYKRPLIHYDMALFLAPMEMAGAVLGVLVQKILPNWLYLLIAGLVLFFTAYTTYKKFFATYKLENSAGTVQEAEMTPRETEALVTNDCEGTKSAPTTLALETLKTGSYELLIGQSETDDNINVSSKLPSNTALLVDDDMRLQRVAFLEEDERQYPSEKIASLFILWIGLFVLTLMKGGKGVESIIGIHCNSPWYIVLIAFQFLWMFLFALYYGWRLFVKQSARVAVWYPYFSDDPSWDHSSLMFYGASTFIAGVVAGLIGIGGGMILGPLMLVMGINPRVSSATTATMIVLTSSSVAVIFVTSGIVPLSYAVFYFIVCFFGALFGKSVIDGYVKKTGKASVLIFILATIIALATLGCFVILFTRLQAKGWCFDGFNKFCSYTGAESKDACPADRLLEINKNA